MVPEEDVVGFFQSHCRVEVDVQLRMDVLRQNSHLLALSWHHLYIFCKII